MPLVTVMIVRVRFARGLHPACRPLGDPFISESNTRFFCRLETDERYEVGIRGNGRGQRLMVARVWTNLPSMIASQSILSFRCTLTDSVAEQV